MELLSSEITIDDGDSFSTINYPSPAVQQMVGVSPQLFPRSRRFNSYPLQHAPTVQSMDNVGFTMGVPIVEKKKYLINKPCILTATNRYIGNVDTITAAPEGTYGLPLTARGQLALASDHDPNMFSRAQSPLQISLSGGPQFHKPSSQYSQPMQFPPEQPMMYPQPIQYQPQRHQIQYLPQPQSLQYPQQPISVQYPKEEYVSYLPQQPQQQLIQYSSQTQPPFEFTSQQQPTSLYASPQQPPSLYVSPQQPPSLYASSQQPPSLYAPQQHPPPSLHATQQQQQLPPQYLPEQDTSQYHQQQQHISQYPKQLLQPAEQQQSPYSEIQPSQQRQPYYSQQIHIPQQSQSVPCSSQIVGNLSQTSFQEASQTMQTQPEPHQTNSQLGHNLPVPSVQSKLFDGITQTQQKEVLERTTYRQFSSDSQEPPKTSVTQSMVSVSSDSVPSSLKTSVPFSVNAEPLSSSTPIIRTSLPVNTSVSSVDTNMYTIPSDPSGQHIDEGNSSELEYEIEQSVEISTDTDILSSHDTVIEQSLTSARQIQKTIVKQRVPEIDESLLDTDPKRILKRSVTTSTIKTILTKTRRKRRTTGTGPDKLKMQGYMEDAKCDTCGGLGPKTKFKGYRRFCSTKCARMKKRLPVFKLFTLPGQMNVTSGRGSFKKILQGEKRAHFRDEDQIINYEAEDKSCVVPDNESSLSYQHNESITSQSIESNDTESSLMTVSNDPLTDSIEVKNELINLVGDEADSGYYSTSQFSASNPEMTNEQLDEQLDNLETYSEQHDEQIDVLNETEDPTDTSDQEDTSGNETEGPFDLEMEESMDQEEENKFAKIFHQTLKEEVEIDEIGDVPKLSVKLPTKWTPQDVYEFVKHSTGSEEYASAFLAHQFDGQALLLLSNNDLMNTMGMRLGHALKLIKCIKNVRKKYGIF